MEKKASKNKLNIIIIILLIIIIGIGGYIAYDKIFITPKENAKENNTENKNNNDTLDNTMSNEEAINLGKKLWDYAYGSYWCSEDVWKTNTDSVNQNGGESNSFNTTSEEIKNKYTPDFKADSCLTEESSCTSYDINSFIPKSCNETGRGVNQTYMDTTIDINTINEDEIKFTATSTYCNSSFCHEGKTVAKTINKDFIIKKVGNNWLISYFYLPN